jgi:uncharacterized protein
MVSLVQVHGHPANKLVAQANLLQFRTLAQGPSVERSTVPRSYAVETRRQTQGVLIGNAMVDITERLKQIASPERIEAFSRQWKVRELALFGSVFREDFRPDSDIDVLISFTDDAPWSLWDLAKMSDELAAIFGRKVDLVETEGLRNPFRRAEILRTRRIIYSGG